MTRPFLLRSVLEPLGRRWRLAGVALAMLLGSAGRASAVTVSPTALYLSSRNPSAILTLLNTGTRPEEIDIRFGFGYATSDSIGNVRVDIVDSAGAGEPSVAPWLRAFPRRLVLQPGQRQSVRITVIAPAGLAAGEYWGRVLVKSKGGEPPIEQTNGAMKMQLSLETTFATAVFYQVGEMSTGITVPTSSAERVMVEGKPAVQFTIDLKRQGNAAFLGRLVAEVVDRGGKTWATYEDVAAVYRALRLRVVIRSDTPLPDGPLVVRYTVDTDRPDLPSRGPVRAAPVTGLTAVGK